MRECARNWRAKNPQRAAEVCREYRARGGDEYRARRAARHKTRYETDGGFRISHIVRSSVQVYLRRGGGAKAERTAYYLGYPVARLIEWAKRNGYNPPETEIDHCRPICEFLAKYPNDIVRALREAWHLGNLRIIPRDENRRKSGRRELLA